MSKAGSQLLEELAEWVACQVSPRADAAATAAMARELLALAAAELGPDGLPMAGSAGRPSGGGSSAATSAPTTAPASGSPRRVLGAGSWGRALFVLSKSALCVCLWTPLLCQNLTTKTQAPFSCCQSFRGCPSMSPTRQCPTPGAGLTSSPALSGVVYCAEEHHPCSIICSLVECALMAAAAAGSPVRSHPVHDSPMDFASGGAVARSVGSASSRRRMPQYLALLCHSGHAGGRHAL